MCPSGKEENIAVLRYGAVFLLHVVLPPAATSAITTAIRPAHDFLRNASDNTERELDAEQQSVCHRKHAVQNRANHLPTLIRANHPIWAASVPAGCYPLRPPSPFPTNQPESWYPLSYTGMNAKLVDCVLYRNTNPKLFRHNFQTRLPFTLEQALCFPRQRRYSVSYIYIYIYIYIYFRKTYIILVLLLH